MQAARTHDVTTDAPTEAGAPVAIGGQVAAMQRMIATRMGTTAGGAWEIEPLPVAAERHVALVPIAIGLVASLAAGAAAVLMLIA